VAAAGARTGAAAILLAAVLALSGCSGGEGGAAGEAGAGSAKPRDEVTVLQPGRPGDDASTVDPTAGVEEFNQADVAFVQMMVPHHAQAIQMARLAESRAADDAVLELAERIRAAQGPEILAMSAWLDDHDVQVPTAHDDPQDFDHGEHGHDPMAGMLTEAQMRALARAHGTRFDRLFLRGMIGHHRGAVTMARNVADSGVDVRVSEMAADVALTQTAEIDRMRQLLRGL